MPKTQIPLIQGDSIGIETDYRDELAVNIIAVPKSVLGGAGYMICHSGLDSFATGNGIDRGANYNERLINHFRLSGDQLIEVDTAGVVNYLGAISGTDQAAMPYSFNTQCVIADGKMFLYDPVGGFVEVTDPDLGEPIDGVWVDGYYFMTDGEFLFHTDLDDETSIDPLKFATSEFSPDPTLAVGLTQDDKVIVFNRYSTEYFINVATDNFAFTRQATRAQKIGIVATHAKVEIAGQWVIVGSRKNESLGVHVVGIGSSLKISSREIDKVLKQYTEPELADMRVEAREEDAIGLIYFHLPNETLCYNSSAAAISGHDKAWSIITTGQVGDPWRAINGVNDTRLNKWIYGDKTDATIGVINDSLFSQYGERSELILFTPFFNLETMSLDEIEIETIPGLNAIDDATVAFSMTKDGLNWSSEFWDLYGEPLDYNKRYIIRRLGNVNQWVGLKFRAYTTSRMSFAMLSITYG